MHFCVSEGETSKTSYQMLPGQHISPESIFLSQRNQSVEVCIYLCTKMEHCLALSYHPDDACHIASQRPIASDVSSPNSIGDIYSTSFEDRTPTSAGDSSQSMHHASLKPDGPGSTDCSKSSCVLMKGKLWSHFTLYEHLANVDNETIKQIW